MSRNYDNWERLVAAVLKRELIWKICHEHSRTPSLMSSNSSDFGSSFDLSSSFSRASFNFADPKDGFFRFANSALPFHYFADHIKISGAKEDGQLVHFEGSPFSFGLQELLASPSSVLGDELDTFRNVYIVRLIEGVTFVVKRLERVGLTQEELEQKAKAIGSIEHENVVKLRGCYLSMDVNLGFFDYIPQGSLYKMLHGKNGENRVHLDWTARTRVAIGAARGLAHVHRHRERDMYHGNVKSSNIFINSHQYGCLADMNLAASRVSAASRFCNYHPPDVLIRLENLSQASDVYSFGIVLIELISGRSPLRWQTTFVDWAIHNMRDGCTAMLFDKWLLKDPLGMQGMSDMLVVALSCVKKKSQERPNMDDVVEMLESIT